jgi:hypothetical protein
MYIRRNTGARSYNQCYSEKSISITYSECVFVAVGIQHTMRNIATCGVSAPTIFSTLPLKRYDFRGGKVIEHCVCVVIFRTKFV